MYLFKVEPSYNPLGNIRLWRVDITLLLSVCIRAWPLLLSNDGVADGLIVQSLQLQYLSSEYQRH